MGLQNYIRKGLEVLALVASLSFVGCGESKIPYPFRLENRIEQEEVIKNHTPDKYAVLVAGGWEQMFRGNVLSAYQTLIENGYDSSNIYVLADDRIKPFNHPVDDISSKQSLSMILTHLSKKIDEEDTFLFYLNDHGKRETIESVDSAKITISNFSIRGEDINEIELEAYLSSIKSKRKMYVFDFCYSGGFSERLGRGNNIAVSSAPSDKGSIMLWQEGFSRYFFNAFKAGSGADYNRDGRVSYREAFDYTKQASPIAGRCNASQLDSDISPDEVFLN